MAAEPPATVASLQAEIDAVRGSYGNLRTSLEASLAKLYADPASVADELLSQTDEFGQEYALAAFAERPHEFGTVRELEEYPWAETAERAAERLAQLVDAHNRLDYLTLQREVLLRREDPVRLPVVNIHGREFALDATKREIRPSDNPNEHHPLELEPMPQHAHLVDPAQPRYDHDRTRKR
jgi:hypothetical protein